jgi:hypothetical protein
VPISASRFCLAAANWFSRPVMTSDRFDYDYSSASRLANEFGNKCNVGLGNGLAQTIRSYLDGEVTGNAHSSLDRYPGFRITV